ncbi:MAG: DNA gyrase subunit B, partial [Gammaproteobacteria bacterium]|nr:DNA gyrase subunit B [Gammaproteobacteria bacterium]
ADGGKHSAVLTRRYHGVEHQHVIGPGFFASSDYDTVANIAKDLNGLTSAESTIQKGDKTAEVRTFSDAMRWLLQEGKRGLHVQRYKGLGEMNPDQLWETTMDPNTRRMLQVRIEDAVAADALFSTLMGDEVEPRRDFIESNALLAANLDV